MFSTNATSNSNATTTTATSTAVKPILADKFKTKACRSFVVTGVCPYASRCMFAHGAAELRTKEMNLRDGLVTEEAIRAFRRVSAPPTLATVVVTMNIAPTFNIVAKPAVPTTSSIATVHPACDCAACFRPRPAAVYTHDPYNWFESPACACVKCAAFNTTWAVPECGCRECAAATRTLPSCYGSDVGESTAAAPTVVAPLRRRLPLTLAEVQSP